MSELLRVENVSSGYGRIEVLHDVSMAIQEDKITCLIGPNGAGKSTLLKTVFGIIKPWTGRVFFRGDDVTGLEPQDLINRNLVYLPQGRSVFPYMTVMENLEMGVFALREKDRDKIEEDIEWVFSLFPPLRGKRDVLAGTLSGGQQRMLEIGRALLLHPKLLMLDEPSAGLAPIIMEQVYEKIREMLRAGITILLIEQNVFQGLTNSDYAYILYLGKNMFEGTSEEALKSKELLKAYLGI
ncbi:MAG: ABC transporter ATP-binding protein [Candidatus Geothermarchaeales archaeon]